MWMEGRDSAGQLDEHNTLLSLLPPCRAVIITDKFTSGNFQKVRNRRHVSVCTCIPALSTTLLTSRAFTQTHARTFLHVLLCHSCGLSTPGDISVVLNTYHHSCVFWASPPSGLLITCTPPWLLLEYKENSLMFESLLFILAEILQHKYIIDTLVMHIKVHNMEHNADSGSAGMRVSASECGCLT